MIHRLINHCTDWAWTGVTSFGRQFDFHDVIYHIQPCNIDNRWHNIVFTTNGRYKTYIKTTCFSQHKSYLCVSVQTRVTGNSITLLKMAESLYILKYSFILLIFFCVSIEINWHWQWFGAKYKSLSVNCNWINHPNCALVLFAIRLNSSQW